MTVIVNVEKRSQENQRYSLFEKNSILMVFGTVAIILGDTLTLILTQLTSIYIVSNFTLYTMQPIKYSLPGLGWQLLLYILALLYTGLYHARAPFWHEVKLAVKSMVGAFNLNIIFILFIDGEKMYFSLFVATLMFLFNLFVLPITRYFVKKSIIGLGIWQKPIIILGDGKIANLFIKGINNEVFMGYKHYQVKTEKAKNFKYVNSLIKETGARDIFVADAGLSKRQLVEMINTLQQKSTNVVLIPELMSSSLLEVELDCLFDNKSLLVFMHNNLSSRWTRILKRMSDLLLGTIAFFISCPIMLVIAIAIRLDSKGNAVFTQERLGKGEKRYKCYKFRTMYFDNDQILAEYLKKNPEAKEEWEIYNKLRGFDPRLTRVGKIIRKFSLDELPQLLNVIKGEMSLVGPRPYLPREREKMDIYADTILKIPPGITGLWQVSGRNEIDFDGRLAIDTWFVRNWTLWKDITILFRTVGAVLSKTGAY